jgi:hypothetical protein
MSRKRRAFEILTKWRKTATFEDAARTKIRQNGGVCESAPPGLARVRIAADVVSGMEADLLEVAARRINDFTSLGGGFEADVSADGEAFDVATARYYLSPEAVSDDEMMEVAVSNETLEEERLLLITVVTSFDVGVSDALLSLREKKSL